MREQIENADSITTQPWPGVEHYPAISKNHARNIALICAAVLAMFWRVFFLGETLIDQRTLDNQLPWGYYATETSDHAYNRRDITDTYVTRDYFVVASYRDGELPLWNPYTMAGHPIYADGVTRWLSPFMLVYTTFDIPLGYSIARILELMFAGIFMYLFLVKVGAGPQGGLMGSLVFTFSAHSMFHVSGLGWWGGLMWLPLILLFADRAATRRSYKAAILAGVFLGAQFFCGWVQNQIYYAGVVVLYYLFLGFRRRAPSQVILLLSVTLIVGFALGATQWVPVMEMLRYSNRRIVPTEIGYIYLPPWYLATLVFPNLFGTADDARTLTLFTALGVSHDHILYIGIAALAPFGYSLYWLRNQRRKRKEGEAVLPDSDNPGLRIEFFALMAAFALFVMLVAPLYVHITKYIPVLQVIRVTVRVWVLLSFAASTLVAFGLRLMLEADKETINRMARFARRALVGSVFFVMLGVAASLLLRLSGFAQDTEAAGKLAFLKRAAAVLSAQFLPPDLSILMPLVLISAVAVVLWLYGKGRWGREVFFASLVGILLIDLFWIGAQFNPTFDRSRVFQPTIITDQLRGLPPGRVLIIPSDLESNRRVTADSAEGKIIAPPNTLLPYGIAVVSGKNQQFPRWYRDFAGLIEPQPHLSHVVFDQPRSEFFDLLNVKYVLTHANNKLPDFQLLGTAEGVSLYENKNAMPRAFFPQEVVRAEDSGQALSFMRASAFNPKRAAVVENAGPGFDAQPLGGVATVIEETRNRVAISTDSESGGMLVLSDNYYPGWRAQVDGVAVEIFKANVTMRAVRVPAGRHRVTFDFAPGVLKYSAYASVAALVLALAALAIAARYEKRRES
jgi:membrane protein YfhO